MTTQGQRFRRRALRRGYKVDEVDAFLDRAEATLAGDPLDEPVTATEVHDVVFRVRFGGYDEWQVDVYLDRLERQLSKLEEEGGHPAAAARPAEAPGRRSREEPAYQQQSGRRGYGGEPGYGEGYGPEAGYGAEQPPYGAEFERGGRGRGEFGPGREEFGREEPAYGQPLDEPTMIRRDRPTPPAAAPPPGGAMPPAGRMPPPERMPSATPPPAAHDAPPRRGMGEGPHMAPGAPPPAAAPPPPPPAAGPGPDMTQQIPNMRAGSDGYEVPGRHGKMDMTTEIGAGDSPFTPDDLARLDQLRRTFQLRRFGSGYDRGQVDRLFDAIGATMAGRSAVTVTEGELDPGQFSLVQGGYFEAEIDTALREVRDLFSRRGVTR